MSRALDTLPPEDLHAVWRAPWWPVAKAVAVTHDVTILDPDAIEDAVYHQPDWLGVISVRTHVGLGWTLIASEAEPDTEEP